MSVLSFFLMVLLTSYGTTECPIYQNGNSVEYYTDSAYVVSESTGTLQFWLTYAFTVDVNRNMFVAF